ncbi:MAG TPA: trehalase-like domain-containing protein, partial [Tepidisphaeraceae bacterium]|nr:trehalase-like domain-containing protein [Tepidisphaeraceae bacterium]
MSYQPIEHYGVIGDLRTAALVGNNGSIDWLCLPDFDSPSVFAAILDDRKGGSFSLTLEDQVSVKQMYLPNTNVLVTRFFSNAGMAEVIDFMSVARELGGETSQACRQLVRIVKAIRGPARFRAVCRPAFDYARQAHEVTLGADGSSALFDAPGGQLVLKSS